MDWQREMCGEVCRMDDRIAVVDDQGGWDVFDLGMNRLDGGEETDIETAKTRCEAWSKTSKYVDDTLYYYTGEPFLDDLHFVKETDELWGDIGRGLMYTAEWWEPNVTLTLQSATWGETWDWIAEDRNTNPWTHYMGQDFPSVESALANFLRTTWGKLGVGVLRESMSGGKDARFDGCEPHWGGKNERSAQATTFTVSQDFGGYRFYMTTSARGEEYEHWWCDFDDGRVAVFDSPDGWQYSIIKYDGNSHDGESLYRSFDDAAYCGIKDFNGGSFVILSGRTLGVGALRDESISSASIAKRSQNFANSPRVPEEVDSKDDQPCPLCGSDHFDGKHCQTCGYDVAPDGLNDIDIDDLDEIEDVNVGDDGDEATSESPIEDEEAKAACVDHVI